MIYSVTRADKDSYRVEVDDKIVGFALRMANNTWKAFGPEMGAPISQAAFKTPRSAAKVLLPAIAK